jgi:hypothetical protein
MKKIIYKIPVLLFLVAVLVGCESDPVIYDSENAQALAQFSSSSLSIGTPEDGASAEAEVTVSTVSSQDREIQVEVDPSSSATTDQFSVSNLVIPAGSYSGKITITSNYDALPENGSANLVLNLVDIAGSGAVVEKGTLKVELFRECAIVLSDFVGKWQGQGSWGDTSLGYTTEVETFLNEDGDLMINGLAFQWFTGWWGEVIVTNEAVKMDINAETGEITIDEQFYITSTWDGEPQPTYYLKATGKVLNACEKTMEIRPVFVQGGSAIDGTAWCCPFVEVIQLME